MVLIGIGAVIIWLAWQGKLSAAVSALITGQVPANKNVNPIGQAISAAATEGQKVTNKSTNAAGTITKYANGVTKVTVPGQGTATFGTNWSIDPSGHLVVTGGIW
ncbi:MAG: hypothetical protein K6T83_07855 [Alicyclobacillus sp.]|nr:hypothetical protein [Alicyclobacillus sp.]